jgi:hypothetical protein
MSVKTNRWYTLNSDRIYNTIKVIIKKEKIILKGKNLKCIYGC